MLIVALTYKLFLLLEKLHKMSKEAQTTFPNVSSEYLHLVQNQYKSLRLLKYWFDNSKTVVKLASQSIKYRDWQKELLYLSFYSIQKLKRKILLTSLA